MKRAMLNKQRSPSIRRNVHDVCSVTAHGVEELLINLPTYKIQKCREARSLNIQCDTRIFRRSRRKLQ